MSISSLTYKDYSFADHGEVYLILERLFSQYNIHYYLVGANARDVHLYKAGIKPTRLTGDIDFAIMVQDMGSYDTVLDTLTTMGFKRTKEPYRLIYEKTNTIIDLMPYGKIEQDYTINFTKRAISLSVLGFTEVGQYREHVTIKETGYTLPTTPVEGLIILKLVAWNHNPSRTKDLDDISSLLAIAWELYEEEAYQNHLDLFNDDFEMTKVAARILGRKMRPILAKNKTLHTTIIGILQTATTTKAKAENLEITLAQNMDKSLEEIQKVLSEIKQGIIEKSTD